jgi:hypothetical protein
MRRPAQPSLKKLLEDDNLIIMRIRGSLRATESCISVRQPPKLHKVLKLRLIDPRNAKLEGNLDRPRNLLNPSHHFNSSQTCANIAKITPQ